MKLSIGKNCYGDGLSRRSCFGDGCKAKVESESSKEEYSITRIILEEDTLEKWNVAQLDDPVSVFLKGKESGRYPLRKDLFRWILPLRFIVLIGKLFY